MFYKVFMVLTFSAINIRFCWYETFVITKTVVLTLMVNYEYFKLHWIDFSRTPFDMISLVNLTFQNLS